MRLIKIWLLSFQASEAWGIACMRYEIRDIRMPARVQEAMQMQVEAERKKRAAILESEGIKAAEINIAEGKKQSRILASGKTFKYSKSSISVAIGWSRNEAHIENNIYKGPIIHVKKSRLVTCFSINVVFVTDIKFGLTIY